MFKKNRQKLSLKSKSQINFCCAKATSYILKTQTLSIRKL